LQFWEIIDHPQSREGVENGPSHLIDYARPDSLVKSLEGLGWEVDRVLQDLEKPSSANGSPTIGMMKNTNSVSRVTEVVAKEVKKHIANEKLVVNLGGDHSLAIGTISGTFSKYPEACVIWIDAHADIHTSQTTETGHIHGMPLSFLLGLGPEVKEFSWVKPMLKPERLVYIGLRDVDFEEKKILRSNGIKAFSMHEVDELGIGEVVRQALKHVNPNGTRPVHLSFDIDALDPTVAPSTGTPVRGGLTFSEGHYICEAIYKTGLLVAFDLMEVNPLKDQEKANQTLEVGCSLVRSALALGESVLIRRGL
ncbi:hypothetical protein CVT26_000723, partial [Gymnopilus dilepis]